jgi:hypothetical protein
VRNFPLRFVASSREIIGKPGPLCGIGGFEVDDGVEDAGVRGEEVFFDGVADFVSFADGGFAADADMEFDEEADAAFADAAFLDFDNTGDLLRQ